MRKPRKKPKFRLAKVVQPPEYPDITGSFRTRWFDLPKEIRLHILSFTDLVFKDHPHHVVSGVRIHNGKILSNNRSPLTSIYAEKEDTKRHQADDRSACQLDGGPNCPCQHNMPSILEVKNAVFRQEAMEVLLSHNRIVFEPQNPKHILKWLESQGQMVKRIRQLDMQFSFIHKKKGTLLMWHKRRNAYYRSWTTLVAYIRDHFLLSKLDLSIDTSLDSVIIIAFDIKEEIRKNKVQMRNSFRRAVKPLKKFGPKKGLKSFSAFFSCENDEELMAERRVMGPGYRPPHKTRYPSRSAWYPHGNPFPGKEVLGDARLSEFLQATTRLRTRKAADASSESSSDDSDSDSSSSASSS